MRVGVVTQKLRHRHCQKEVEIYEKKLYGNQTQTLQIFNLLDTLIYEKPIFNETTNLDISHLIPSAYVIKIKNTNAQLVWIKE